MIQLHVLSGKMAGTRWVARRFPVRIGRAAANDFQLEEPGIWDEHLRLQFDRDAGFTLTACPGALVTINHKPVESARLRNGDSLEIGGVRMEFSLAEPRQRRLRISEGFVWTMVIAVAVAQVALIWWLLQ